MTDKKAKILDIAMNLTRVGNWAADGYVVRQKRIEQFLDQTSQYLSSLSPELFSGRFKKTFKQFLNEYSVLEKAGKKGPKNELEWAERMMTWGNILTHRAQLIKHS